MIVGFGNLSSEERLRKTDLISLEMHRVRGDLIQVFKMLKGFDKVNFDKFFKFSPVNKTRGHSYKLFKGDLKLEMRKNFFTQRVVSS